MATQHVTRLTRAVNRSAHQKVSPACQHARERRANAGNRQCRRLTAALSGGTALAASSKRRSTDRTRVATVGSIYRATHTHCNATIHAPGAPRTRLFLFSATRYGHQLRAPHGQVVADPHATRPHQVRPVLATAEVCDEGKGAVPIPVLIRVFALGVCVLRRPCPPRGRRLVLALGRLRTTMSPAATRMTTAAWRSVRQGGSV